jgi:hypothetical protein
MTKALTALALAASASCFAPSPTQPSAALRPTALCAVSPREVRRTYLATAA